MVQSYTSATQNNNKCPHGLPIGACPICSAMASGGSKRDKNTPRVKGEMSYNECLAEWHKIQARKEAKLNAKLDELKALNEYQKNNIILKGLNKIVGLIEKANVTVSNLLNKFANLPKIFSTPISMLLNNIIKPILNLTVNILNNLQLSLVNILKTTKQTIQNMMSMASVVFGEIQQFIENFKTNKFSKAIKIFLNLFNENNKDEQTEEEDKIQKRELILKKIKEVFKGVFRRKDKKTKDFLENE